MQAETRRQALREALVGAAESAVAERGLGSLKARDLAATAGCAVGAIYNVFPDLDALILDVNIRTLALFEAAMRRDLGADPAADDPEAALVRLAEAYLSFAIAHPARWRALFQHRLPEGRTVPDWYAAQQGRLFDYVEGPLGRLRPDLPEADRHLLARTFFSATHGIVGLGLDEKLLTLPVEVLRAQLRAFVLAAARGLRAQAPGG